MDDLIEKYAAHNALKFGGKANENAVLGSVLRDSDEAKADIDATKKRVHDIVQRVNDLSEQDLQALADKYPLEEKPKEAKDLKPLPAAKKGKVVMRFEPSPSGPLHIGHAYGLLVNHEYTRRNDGRLILRIADTNPDKIYPPAYEQIPRDAEWLCGEPIEVEVQSDRMDLYYAVAERCLLEGYAYVCTCSQESFKEFSTRMDVCPCRDLVPELHIERWEQMKRDAPMGWAVVRIKTDMKHKNPAMRDWPALRINTNEHPRQANKYRVWPMMNFSVAVDDHDMGLTHVIHGKDQLDNTKRQRYLFDYLGWDIPERLFWGRINFEDMRVSCSKTRPLVDSKELDGWDDIRIPFVASLKRRGFQPDTFRQYAIDVGVSLNDKTVTSEDFYKKLNALNKDLIDEHADRYFFIPDPQEIVIDDAPNMSIDLKKHPDHPSRGTRHFETTTEFMIAKDDLERFDDAVIRLMDCLNFQKEKERFTFVSDTYDDYKKFGKFIIHWLPKHAPCVDVTILMPDHSQIKGIGEQTLTDLSIGDIIQFERFGFVRLDEKRPDGSLSFWFAHK